MPEELRPARPQYLRSLSEQARRDGSRQHRVDYYEEVQRLKRDGLKVSQVKLVLGRNYPTVRFYYDATSFPERMPGRSPHSVLTPYLEYLETRFRQGAVTAPQLREAILAQGFGGSEGTVSKWLRARRLVEGQDPDIEITSLPLTDSSSVCLPRLGWLGCSSYPTHDWLTGNAPCSNMFFRMTFLLTPMLSSNIFGRHCTTVTAAASTPGCCWHSKARSQASAHLLNPYAMNMRSSAPPSPHPGATVALRVTSTGSSS